MRFNMLADHLGGYLMENPYPALIRLYESKLSIADKEQRAWLLGKIRQYRKLSSSFDLGQSIQRSYETYLGRRQIDSRM